VARRERSFHSRLHVRESRCPAYQDLTSIMQRSLERFQLAPEDFFAGVDRGFADLRAMVDDLAGHVEAQAELITQLSRTRMWPAPPPAAVARWSYDARLPNFLFADVFEPEALPGGAKRWVGRAASIAARLRLPRNAQYDIEIEIEDFVSPAAAQSFYLKVNGVQYPWLSHRDGRYASLVLEDIDAEGLAFEIGIDPATIPPGRDVSFAFRAIDVRQRK